MSTEETPEQQARNGFLAALVAFTSWGFIPVYFIVVKEVSSLEVLVHRIVWAVPFGAVIIAARRQWGEVRAALLHRKMLLLLSVSALFIAINWLFYIWAIQAEQIYQSSLAYYINPLLFALAGVVLFGERLRRQQILAIGVASVGVLILTMAGGQVPGFCADHRCQLHGVRRDSQARRHRRNAGSVRGDAGAVPLFSLAYLAWISLQGTAVFGAGNTGMSSILVLAGPITIIPLLFFAPGDTSIEPGDTIDRDPSA